MTTFTDLASVAHDPAALFTDRLRLAVAAYLARFKGTSREHTESDLRCYLARCAERGLDPLAAQRPHLELYLRWMHEIRRFKPSTVSRRFLVTAGFYRTCVIDGILEHSPAEYVRRPAVPAESPTLGFSSAIRGPAHRRPPVTKPVRLRVGRHARAARLADLRSNHPAVPTFRAGPRPRQVHRTSASAASSADNDSGPIKAWPIRVAFDANK